MSVPIMELAGSETWRWAYDIGNDLEAAFPNQDGSELGYAAEYNGWGPIDSDITGLLMIEQGCRDDGSWIWLVTTNDGKSYWCEAWCDYTGWDCQSGISWTDYKEQL